MILRCLKHSDEEMFDYSVFNQFKWSGLFHSYCSFVRFSIVFLPRKLLLIQFILNIWMPIGKFESIYLHHLIMEKINRTHSFWLLIRNLEPAFVFTRLNYINWIMQDYLIFLNYFAPIFPVFAIVSALFLVVFGCG